MPPASPAPTLSGPSETSPLLPKPTTDDGVQTSSPRSSRFGPVFRVYFSSILNAMAFAFTQSSLIYAFRVMTCDEYYKTHEWDPSAGGDRCAVHRIEAETARNIALMGASTTFFTIVNVFVVNHILHVSGVKSAMFQQTAWAAIRNLCQIYAQTVGGARGILIIQITQCINILGSGGGYQLAGNAYIAGLAGEKERTGMFGVLGGLVMFGNAVGYVGGGLAYRYIGTLAPFFSAFGLLLFASIFGALFLPYIAPHSASSSAAEKPRKSPLAPLKIFVPRKLTLPDGRLKRDYNLLLLGSGAFFSVFATAYVPMGLQLVGTNVFGFQPTESGAMLSLTLLVKAFFLSICFPRIITAGRQYYTISPSTSPTPVAPGTPAERDPSDNPTSPLLAPETNETDTTDPEPAPAAVDSKHGSTFDLHFLQYSILLDSILTACVSLSSKGLHLYIAAAIIPFASATGSAARGVTLDFVVPEMRSDALGAIALVEKIAQVLTVGWFGYLFGELSERGQPMLLFLFNAAIAVIGFLLLIPVRMPRPGQELLS